MVRKFLRLFSYVRELERRAFYDDLTGTLRRGAFFEALERELDYALRHGQHVALFVLDMDGFKEVNDSHGHATGDHFLAWFGKTLLRQNPTPRIVGRLGGDEFVIFTRFHMAAEREIARHIKVNVESETFRDRYSGVEIRPRVSIGHASTRVVGYTDAVNAMFRAADAEMYSDKDVRRRVRKTPR